MLTFRFSGTEGIMAEPERLTSGMVGKELLLELSQDWEGLSKTVVFSNGSITLDAVYAGEYVTIPAQILEEPLKKLTVGIYGVAQDGKLVIPTIRAEGPEILPGVDPSGDIAMDPELPVWAQIQAAVGDIAALETEDTSSLVAAINELAARSAEDGAPGDDGATFTPHVTSTGVLTWTNDKGLANPSPVNVRGPMGPQGIQGPSGPQGAQGPAGADGYSPVRGTDYWTDADKAEIKAYVDEAILEGAW